MWIVYCEEKNRKLNKSKGRMNITFQDCIDEILNKQFKIISSPGKMYQGQYAFLLQINEYPIIVPFSKRNQVIQLITFFPDRRFK